MTINQQGVVTRWVETFLLWQQRRQERRELSALADGQLKDMGFNRSDVYREAGKPFWQA